jgi:hypothetical protein
MIFLVAQQVAEVVEPGLLLCFSLRKCSGKLRKYEKGESREESA